MIPFLTVPAYPEKRTAGVIRLYTEGEYRNIPDQSDELFKDPEVLKTALQEVSKPALHEVTGSTPHEVPKSALLEVSKSTPHEVAESTPLKNKTEINNTDLNHIESNHHVFCDLFNDPVFRHSFNRKRVKTILNVDGWNIELHLTFI